MESSSGPYRIDEHRCGLHLVGASPLTFPTGRLRSPLPQTVLYGVVQFIGLSINYAVFSALIFAGAFWREFPILAVAAGSLTAMTATYLLSKTIAFAEPGGLVRRKKRFAQT